jgi:hypothetical protein
MVCFVLFLFLFLLNANSVLSVAWWNSVIVAGTKGGAIHVWRQEWQHDEKDAEEGGSNRRYMCVDRWQGHQSAVMSLVASGSAVWSGSLDCTVKILDLSDLSKVKSSHHIVIDQTRGATVDNRELTSKSHTIPVYQGSVVKIAVSGNTVVTGCAGKNVFVYEW